MTNQIELAFPSLPENEAFARMVISSFLVPLNPTLSVLSEIRTAVSEAVTNCVVHAYPLHPGKILLRALSQDGFIQLEIEDYGQGIDDIDKAMKPFFSSKPEDERSGMGFALMQSFMDHVIVQSTQGQGTKVIMTRLIKLDDLSDEKEDSGKNDKRTS